jgi:hypothetical protein
MAVARFFASRHYGKFLVFNLCEAHEEGGNGNYDIDLLYGQVSRVVHARPRAKGSKPYPFCD